MDQPIVFTLADILWLAGAIVAIAGATKVIVGTIERLRMPNMTQNKRIEELERKSKIDYERLNKIEEGNIITQKAILALLSHGIDGNDIESMKQAKKELTNYLVENKSML
jgi:hypothetical protein